MKKKVVIAGGTGFIGKYLHQKYSDLGYEVLIISRGKNHIEWSETEKIIEALENADVLINLAGKSVDCRYNEKNRTSIMNSRIKTTKILGDAVLACLNPPKNWFNSSTATIYRHAEDRPMTEKNGEIGEGFSVDVAKNWEQTFFSFHTDKTRQIALRIAIVLGKDGGVIEPFKNLVRFGMGGKQGNGRQMFSWIHIEDLFQIIRFLELNPALSGVFNCSAPNPVNNMTLMKKLRSVMKVKFGLPSPTFLLKIGAFFINTESELILKSRWVLPERLLEAEYKFRFPELDLTLNDILKKK